MTGRQHILVLGGSGFIGQQLCEALVAGGHRVSVPSRRAANARSVQALPGVQVLEGSVHDAQALARWLPGHDAVVNLVAILQGKAADFERVHVQLPKTLAQAMHRGGVPRLVQVSALGASAQAPSMYLRSKAAGDAALQAAGLPQLHILRPSVVFGAGDRFLNLFAKLQALFPVMPLGGAQAGMQPVWVQDVVRFLAAAALGTLPSTSFDAKDKESRRVLGLDCYSSDSKNQITEAVGPQIHTLREIVEIAGRLSGNSRPVLPLPASLAKLQALALEFAPGEPLMSRDNLASLRVPNVATQQHPTLTDWGMRVSSLRDIAPSYLAPSPRLDELRRSAGR